MTDPQFATPVPKRPMKLSTALALMVGAVLLCVLISVHLLYFSQLGQREHASVRDKALAVARTLATLPAVKQALMQPPDAATLQPVAREIQLNNDLLFVVVTNMQGIRYSHRDPAQVGQHFVGDDLQPAL